MTQHIQTNSLITHHSPHNSPPPLHFAESDDSDIKIADFGFAKRIKDLLPKETACGTPGYVAPEILRGDRYGAEVDIWR